MSQENKTKATLNTVEEFLSKVEDETARKDSNTLIDLMQRATGQPPVMWGPAIIGFDKYRYKYESGREGEICLIGFSPRKGKLAFYNMFGFAGSDELLARLGKYTTGKGCLYIKKLSEVDTAVLEELAVKAVGYYRAKYPNI